MLGSSLQAAEASHASPDTWYWTVNTRAPPLLSLISRVCARREPLRCAHEVRGDQPKKGKVDWTKRWLVARLPDFLCPTASGALTRDASEICDKFQVSPLVVRVALGTGIGTRPWPLPVQALRTPRGVSHPRSETSGGLRPLLRRSSLARILRKPAFS